MNREAPAAGDLETTNADNGAEMNGNPDAVLVRGHWFARPSGEGTDVGPFSSKDEALAWIAGEGQ